MLGLTTPVSTPRCHVPLRRVTDVRGTKGFANDSQRTVSKTLSLYMAVWLHAKKLCFFFLDSGCKNVTAAALWCWGRREWGRGEDEREPSATSCSRIGPAVLHSSRTGAVRMSTFEPLVPLTSPFTLTLPIFLTSGRAVSLRSFVLAQAPGPMRAAQMCRHNRMKGSP